MAETKKIGIIICDRYRRCAGGKCFRSAREREGAFARYAGQEIEIVGYTSCDGCPGGNIEYAVDEMMGNGVEAVHLATGLIVGYPPCPYIRDFHDFVTKKYGVEVVYGTHPIPEKYKLMHEKLGTWTDPGWDEILEPVMPEQEMRLAYD